MIWYYLSTIIIDYPPYHTIICRTAKACRYLLLTYVLTFVENLFVLRLLWFALLYFLSHIIMWFARCMRACWCPLFHASRIVSRFAIIYCRRVQGSWLKRLSSSIILARWRAQRTSHILMYEEIAKPGAWLGESWLGSWSEHDRSEAVVLLRSLLWLSVGLHLPKKMRSGEAVVSERYFL